MSRVNPNPAACCTCTRRSESCASAAASLVREPASEQRTKSKLAFTRYCYCQKLYGVWHTNGRSEGGRILPNTRVIVLHQGGQFRWARGMIGWLIRAQKSRGKRISCKGQLRTYRSCHERRHMRTREETHRKTACANGRDPGETLRL